MKILLDTHVAIWLALNDEKANRSWVSLVEDKRNEIFVSVASLWEIAIKCSIQKLKLPVSFEAFVEDYILGRDIQVLWISPNHLTEILNLPHHHRDLFDRLIIAQALRNESRSLQTIPNSNSTMWNWFENLSSVE